jgi:hypothetical protein
VREWLDVFDEYAIETSEFIDLGEQVVAVGLVVARGRGSGAETRDEDAGLFRFRATKRSSMASAGPRSSRSAPPARPGAASP